MRKWLALPVVLLVAPVILALEAIERFAGSSQIDDPWWPWFRKTYLR